MSQPPHPPPPPAGSTPAVLSSETRNWAMGAHLSAFAGALVALAFTGPLVVWLLKRDEDPFVEDHAREALNFNLSLLLYVVVGSIVTGVLFLLTFGLVLFLAVPVAVLGACAWIVLTVLAAVAASEGRPHRYPLTIRFLR